MSKRSDARKRMTLRLKDVVVTPPEELATRRVKERRANKKQPRKD